MTDGSSPLLGVYLERRADLVRFFTARLRSASAAEDLVQDIYVRIAAMSPDVQANNPAAYLYRLGSNLMLDRLRGERRTALREHAWREDHRTLLGQEEVSEDADAVATVIARQRLAAVVQALQVLPPQTQRVFRLHKFDGLSHSEVAKSVGISRSAVEKHVMAALKHLARTLP